MPEEKVKQYQCLCPCEHETGCIACENGNHDYHLVPPAADAGPRQPDAAERVAVKIVVECCEGVSDRNLGDYVANVAEMIRKEYATAAAPVSQEAAPRHIKRLDEYRTIRRKSEALDWEIRVAAMISNRVLDWLEQSKENAPPESVLKECAALIRQKGVMPIEPESIRPEPVNAEGAHRASIETSATVAKIVELAKSDPPRCGHDIYDYTSRIYGCCRPKGHAGPHETLEDRHKNRYTQEVPDKQIADIAALIREAGSERERRLMSVLFVIMSDMPKKRDWLDPDIEREASRLLGGESK